MIKEAIAFLALALLCLLLNKRKKRRPAQKWIDLLNPVSPLVPKLYLSAEEVMSIAIRPDKTPGFDYRKQPIGFMYISMLGLLCEVCRAEDVFSDQYTIPPKGPIARRFYHLVIRKRAHGFVQPTHLNVRFQ